MDRKQVLIPEEQTLRQRDFERKIRELHTQRGRSVRALVDTFGCQQNVADSQHIMGMLEAMGCTFVTAPEEADIVVLNTCAIRDHAEKRASNMDTRPASSARAISATPAPRHSSV